MPDNKKPGGSSSGGGPPTTMKINPNKLQAFSVGIHKKTPFQKQKEAEEARRKKEDEEAARVYAEFVASFEDNPSKPKTWVKGSTLVPTVLYDREDAVKEQESKTLYRPQQRFVPSSSSNRSRGNSAQLLEQRDDDDEVEARPPPRGGKKRNLDAFLEEIKRGQEERDQRLRTKHARVGDSDAPPEPSSLTLRAAFEENPGSHDTGDPDTTNLYVGNISPDADEDLICRTFAVHGPIASVKIMWPRTQEERDRKRNCGFVSFMTREAAVSALKNLDGFELLGYAMRVGWGKAVTIPPKPFYVLPGTETHVPSISDSGVKGVPSFKAAASGNASNEVLVALPSDPEVTAIIHRTVERVLKHGPAFEAIIMDRERGNPKFKFLFENESAEHIYYRWKLYSMLQGDPKDRWSTEPFQIFADGSLWKAPDIPFNDDVGTGDTSDSSESESSDSDVEIITHRPANKGTLPRSERLRFERKLRKLNLDRALIGELMIFSLDHSEAAEEIVDTIARSLLIRTTPIFPTKIARLYLVSDILHNSSVSIPNAWKYRTHWEKRLNEVFGHLGTVWKGIGARLRAEQMRRAVFAAVEAWEGWNVFGRDYMEGLKNAFLEAKREEGAEEREEKEERQGEERGGTPGGVQREQGDVQVKEPVVQEEESDDSDVDGAPMVIDKVEYAGASAAGGSTPQEEQDQDMEESDDDEDVDGVPLSLPLGVIGGSAQLGHTSQDDAGGSGVLVADARDSPSLVAPVPPANTQEELDDIFA